ncbi:PAS domain-containing sensor histidine kinase [Fodinibius saliphilus]|uniref:PAS domain-containing sensor histidine kinase n=1 Tax=Fodinibius saliphilus TaxID=1920650 RepID=UPI0011085B7C|nr:PAS domain S-box protein [Fodinibius saliphilus]
MELPSLLFEQNPNPMLVFDTDTLEILAVNESAVKKYGFSEEEFIQLTIEDIRPPKGIPKLREKLDELDNKFDMLDIGTFRHRTKDGKMLYVQLAVQEFSVKGRNAYIVHIHDITETVRLKKEVDEAYREQQYHIENNPLAMVKYDRNFRVIEWSKRAEEKTGYTKEEVLGTSTFDIPLFEGDEVDKIKKRMLALSKGEKNKDRFETKIRLKNGEIMEVLVHASALRNKENDLKSVLAFIENISVRKEYERELLKREMKYHRLFEDANDGIVLLDGNTFIDCNQRATEIFGRDKQDIIGNTPFDFSPEYQPDGSLSEEKAKKRFKQVRKGSPQVFEWVHLRKNGEEEHEITVQVSLNTIELDDNDYVQAIVRDLTDKKRTQKKLTLSNNLLESLFIDAPVAIVMVNTEGQVERINKSFEDLFGYSEQELLGEDLLKHNLPAERYDEIQQIYESVFSGGNNPSKYYEAQRITKDGEEKDLLVGAVPVVIDKELIGAFKIYIDITDLRKTEEKLQNSLQEKKTLLSEVHHRVKNNLAVISGLLLLEAMNWNEQSEVHKALLQSKHRIHSMAQIHELLYESNDFTTVQLQNYIDKLVKTVHDSMQGVEKGVELDIDYDDIYLNINQAMPCALIINELVTNAFKYAFDKESENKLSVSFREESETITIEIRDNGPGLPDQFEKMAKDSLGHKLVKQLVKQLDGDITVQSSDGMGTTYKITFERKVKKGSSSNIIE